MHRERESVTEREREREKLFHRREVPGQTLHCTT